MVTNCNRILLVEERQRSADDFFASQRNRVGKVEKQLLTATGNILPPSKDSKTITELAELCRLTQVATRKKIEVLRSCLVDEGYAVTSPKTILRQGTKATNKISTASSPSFDRKSSRTRSPIMPSVVSRIDDEKRIPAGGVGSQTSLPLVANVGGPLESVLEVEYETDGTTTPGSYMESPMFSSTPRRPSTLAFDSDALVTPLSDRKNKIRKRRTSSSFSFRSPGTPPTLDALRMSASTSKFLQHIEEDEENVEGSARSRSSTNTISFSEEPRNKSIERDQYDEFRDEDDMITLDTTMTKNTTLCSPSVFGATSIEKRSSLEERSQFFARMEGILERVEETILEESSSPTRYNQNISSQSNENQTPATLFDRRENDDEVGRHAISSSNSRGRMSAQSDRSAPRTFYGSEPGAILTENEDMSRTSFSKDSTNVVATQVAESTPLRVIEKDETENVESPHIIRQHPTHVLIESRVASPAHTNITMDATFMNDITGTSFVRDEEKYRTGQLVTDVTRFVDEEVDNLSTVTPVLDRYRLDPADDNSVGVKVVPNKRSAHRMNKKQNPTPEQGRLPTIAQLSPSLDNILHARTPKKESIDSSFRSPSNSRSERNMRMRKVYRKTPFPKRKLVNTREDEDEDENHDPNVTAGTSSQNSPNAFGRGEPYSISVPPLRHSSFEPKRPATSTYLKERHSLPNKTRPSLGSELQSALLPEPSQQSYLKEETDTIRKIDETIERIDQELSSPAIAKKTTRDSSSFFVEEITETEFRCSPNIVQTSVDRDRANLALRAIHRYCPRLTEQFNHFEFSEEEGRDIIGFPDQECRNILISLCHWRRLTMKKDMNHGMIFSISNENKAGKILS